MMNQFNYDEFCSEPIAIDYLADSLRSGTLVLFLGSGVSYNFGLPNWVQLINLLRAKVNLPPITNAVSAERLQISVDEVKYKLSEQNIDLIEIVKEVLYNDLKDLLSEDVFKNQLLIAISALIMGSKRGRVTRVVTLNFDSILEWFLSIFGFVVKTIYSLPECEGMEDARIYHPHGYIPHPQMNQDGSDFIIFGMSSVNERLGTPGDAWFEMVRHILDTGVCLFIGMSGKTLTDRALAPLFFTSGKKLKGKRPLGFWILADELTEDLETEFKTDNIVPLNIRDYAHIREFLLKICQKAMQETIIS